MRKFTVSLLIAVTLWSSLIAPARAVAPLVGLAYLTGANGIEGALIGATSLAAAVMAITLTSDGGAPSSNGSNVAIQIQLDPYTPLTTPESAVGPATSPYTPTEITVSETQMSYDTQGGSGCAHSTTPSPRFASPSSVASYYQPFVQANCGSTTISVQTIGVDQYQACYDHPIFHVQECQQIRTLNVCASDSTWNGSACIKIENTCPSGYTMNTTTQSCNRNNDDVQVADNKIQITRSGDTLQQNPNDPDPIPENLLVRPKDIVISTPEMTTTVHINDDGTIDVKEIKPNANGNTDVNNVKLSASTPGQAPQVIGKSNSQYPGQESGPADPDATVNSPVIPGTGSGSPSSPASGTSVLNLPANLAKTEKQCGYDADHKCTTDVKASVDKLVEEDSSLAASKAAAESKVNSIESGADSFEGAANTTLNTLTSDPLNQHGITWEWLPELPSAQCASVQYGAGTHVYTWDICPVVEKIRDILGYALYVITAISLVYIALGRKAE